MPRSLAAGAAFLAMTLLVGSPAMGGKADDTLVAAFQAQLPSLDRYHAPGREGFLLGLLAYDALIYRDPNSFEIKPLLATSWHQVDSKTWDFTLRPGVKFQNGDDFTSDDVVYSLRYAADPANHVFNQMTGAWIADVTALDPLTVRITARDVTPMTMEYLLQLPIMPHAYRERVGKEAFGRNPVGTGPYKVQTVAGNAITFTRNDDYFAGGGKNKPFIKTLIYRAIPEVNTEIAQLLGGEVDWAYYIPEDAAKRLRNMPSLTVTNAATFRIAFLTLDAVGQASTASPLRDVGARRAIAYAIDRKAIAAQLVGGSSKPIGSACMPRQFGCTQDVAQYDYDPAKAKQLLTEAGFPNGFGIDIYAYRSRPVAEAIIGYLGAVGVHANLKWMQYSAVIQQRRDHKTPIVIDDFGSAGVNDVGGILPFFFGNQPDDQAQDPAVNDPLAQAGTTLDPAIRKAAFTKALTRIADQAYWVPLFTMPVNYVMAKSLDMPVPDDEDVEFWKARWK